MFVVIAGGARHCVFLLVNQTIHLGIAPVSWACSRDRPDRRLARSGGPSDQLAELAVPLLLGLAVLFWLAGFDVIYSLQDRDFDRKPGLHSIPVRFGTAGALRLSSIFHFVRSVFLRGRLHCRRHHLLDRFWRRCLLSLGTSHRHTE